MSPGFRVWQTKPVETPIEITDYLEDGQIWFDPTQKSSLKRDGHQLTVAFFESGIILIASINPISGNPDEYYINFQIKIPKSTFLGRTRGLLGNLDGIGTNDFYRRGSTTPLSNTLSDAVLTEHLVTCKY